MLYFADAVKGFEDLLNSEAYFLNERRSLIRAAQYFLIVLVRMAQLPSLATDLMISYSISWRIYLWYNQFIVNFVEIL